MAKRFKQRLGEDDVSALQRHERANLAAMASGQGGAARTTVELSQIALHGGTQPRAGLSAEVVQEYAGRMSWDGLEGAVVDPDLRPWEPLTLFFDGQTHWLADGFHRVEAAAGAGLDRFQALVWQGSQRDAVAHSLGANATHGARRTNGDKRRAVRRALEDAEWGGHSDRQLAKMCKVSQPFVSKVRAQLERGGHIEPATVRRGAGGTRVEVVAQPKPRRPAATSHSGGVVFDTRVSGGWAKLGRQTELSGFLVALFEQPNWDALGELNGRLGVDAALSFLQQEGCFAAVWGGHGKIGPIYENLSTLAAKTSLSH